MSNTITNLVLSQLCRLAVTLTPILLLAACSETSSGNDRIELVKENMARADYGAASLELANLIQSEPENIDARLLQGKVSLATGRAKAAETQLAQAKNLGASDYDVMIAMTKAVIAQGEFDRLGNIVGAKPDHHQEQLGWHVVKATAARYREDFAVALDHFDHALKLEKNNLDAALGKAELLLAMGNPQEAERLLTNTTETHPLSIAAWQALGAYYFSQNRYLEAERAFINAIEGSDGIDRAQEYMLARAGLIETQWWLDKRSLAIRNSKELINSYPWHPLPKYLRGLLAFLNEEYTTASDYLQRVLDHSPKHKPSLKMLAAISTAQGNLGKSQSLLNRYFELEPDDPEMIYLLAETFLSMGNADQALTTLSPLITDQLAEPHVLELYGVACRHSAHCQDGASYVRRAARLKPGDVGRQVRLASTLLSQGDIEAADQVMSQWNPPSRYTQTGRRILRLERFVRSGQLERAREYAKKLRRENPSDLHALLALAEIAQQNGNTTQAMEWLQLARERNEQAVEPRIILATLMLQQGQYEEAVKIAQEATAAHPYNANVLRIIANASILTNDVSSAVAAASEAVRLAPSQSLNLLVLARAQLATNDFWNAKGTIHKLLEQDQDMMDEVGAVIVEDLLRGNAQQAHHMVDYLQSINSNKGKLFEIEGDLHFIEKNFEAAGDSYTSALYAKPSKLLETKVALMNRSKPADAKLN